MLRQYNHYIISILALILGINYSIFAWLNYDIINVNGDFISSARFIWGVVQTVLGFLLITFILFKKAAYVLFKYWTIIVSIVFAMQLPIASLWYMSLMREPIFALPGVCVHTLLIALISIDYLNAHKSNYKQSYNVTHDNEDSHIKLDT